MTESARPDEGSASQVSAAPQEEPVRCQAETRQLDKINRALNVCDLVERNPEGWGGPQAVSLARTIRQALTGQPVTPHANYGGQGD